MDAKYFHRISTTDYNLFKALVKRHGSEPIGRTTKLPDKRPSPNFLEGTPEAKSRVRRWEAEPRA
jgi:hypothetical protein